MLRDMRQTEAKARSTKCRSEPPKVQTIVAAGTTADANDKRPAVPLAEAAMASLAVAANKHPHDEQGHPPPISNTADSGYHRLANVQGVTAAGLDPYFAVGRDKRRASQVDPAVASSRATDTRVLVSEDPKAAMAKKVRTATGRILYAARKHVVEPVFGRIKGVHGFGKFLLRGLERVSAERQLICLTHNLLKMRKHAPSKS